jgi:hypothetical protein
MYANVCTQRVCDDVSKQRRKTCLGIYISTKYACAFTTFVDVIPVKINSVESVVRVCGYKRREAATVKREGFCCPSSFF